MLQAEIDRLREALEGIADATTHPDDAGARAYEALGNIITATPPLSTDNPVAATNDLKNMARAALQEPTDD